MRIKRHFHFEMSLFVSCRNVTHQRKFIFHADIRAVKMLQKSTCPRTSRLKKFTCPDKNILVRQLFIYHNKQTDE